MEIPRSSFQFDFELERQILAEAEKDSPNWSRLLGLENSPPKPLQSTSSVVSLLYIYIFYVELIERIWFGCFWKHDE